MNAHELPMILFTVIAQMCVGAFVVLGIIQLSAGTKTSSKTVDRLVDPTLLAIGPAMIAGLMVSMLHMNDVFHVMNVFRNFGSSWLTREVTFASLFAGAGFVFAVMQWYKIGSAGLRKLVAFVTAGLGVALVWSMASIYGTLKAVPAWNSWFTPLQFAATTLILGSLLVAVSFLILRAELGKTATGNTSVIDGYQAPEGFFRKWVTGAPAGGNRKWYQRVVDSDDTVDEAEVNSMINTATRWCIVISVIGIAAIMIAAPIYVSGLVTKGGVALASAEVYSSGIATVRYLLLGIGTVVLVGIGYREAGKIKQNAAALLWGVGGAFVIIFIAELLGRSLFYDAMMRVGV